MKSAGQPAQQKGKTMTGNFSVLKEGSTLIGDHKQAVQALEDVLAAGNLDVAKSIVTDALKKLGELETDAAPAKTPDQMVTRGD